MKPLYSKIFLFLTISASILLLSTNFAYADLTNNPSPNDNMGISATQNFIGRTFTFTGEIHSVFVYGQAGGGYTTNSTVNVYDYLTGEFIAQSTSYLYMGPYSMWREYQFQNQSIDGQVLIGVQTDGHQWIAYDNNAVSGDRGVWFTCTSLTDTANQNPSEWVTIPAPADIPSIYVYYGDNPLPPTPTPEPTATPGPDYIGGLIEKLAPALPATIAIVAGTILGGVFVGFLGAFLGFNISFLICFLFELIPLWGLVPMFIVDALLIYGKVETRKK